MYIYIHIATHNRMGTSHTTTAGRYNSQGATCVCNCNIKNISPIQSHNSIMLHQKFNYVYYISHLLNQIDVPICLSCIFFLEKASSFCNTHTVSNALSCC